VGSQHPGMEDGMTKDELLATVDSDDLYFPRPLPALSVRRAIQDLLRRILPVEGIHLGLDVSKENGQTTVLIVVSTELLIVSAADQAGTTTASVVVQSLKDLALTLTATYDSADLNLKTISVEGVPSGKSVASGPDLPPVKVASLLSAVFEARRGAR
jgi:hypothetical protein